MTERVRSFLRSNRRQILLFLLALVLGFSCGMFVQVTIERRELIENFENKAYYCQNSLSSAYNNLGKARSFFASGAREDISNLVYACDAVHDSGRWKFRNLYSRPCITYINRLKNYILDNELNDADAFYLRTRPFIEAHFDGSVWNFLDNLDAQLQTPYGQQALAVLSP